MDIKELLKELTLSFSIGHINGAREILGRVVSPYAEIKEIGNQGLVATIKGDGEKNILIDAHVDEIGFTVTNVDDNGFLTVANCGGIDLRQLPTKQVIIHGKEKVKGVFISTPPHLSKDNEKFSDLSKIKIDTGLSAKAKEIISLGDFVTYDGEFFELGENRVTSKSLDNRAGCAVLALLAERLHSEKLPVNVTLLFSESEELGLRGARTVGQKFNPDVVFALDVTIATDTPGLSKSCKAGNGPAILLMDSSMIGHRGLRDFVVSVAEELGIPYQFDYLKRGGTDAGQLHLSHDGAPGMAVCIPARYIHSHTSIISKSDYFNTIKLLTEVIKRLDEEAYQKILEA
jgi:endoglucanase